MSDRYLVTGGAGFIGSHVVRRLVSDGGVVRVVDNLSTGLETRLDDLRDQIEFIRGDLADDRVSDNVVRDVQYVLHQAAVPSVQRSVRDPVGTNRANVVATLNLLESCRKARVRRFVYAASSSAYGDTEVLPKSEQMSPDPLSPYGLQKLTGERYCKLYYSLYGLETVSLRYFNVFGPSQDPHSEYSAVIPKFVTKMIAGETITVYGDGEQSRDFTYVENVVAANLLALTAPSATGQVCNIGCGERVTLNRLIQLLEKILETRAKVTHCATRKGDVRHSLADIDLARRLLGYEPRVMIEEGLRRTVKAIKSRTEVMSAED
jgi:UDP-N-acetylglucosamine/UDP-N-acetyl-alpha-D-glucosaminouronate 4-epimerase